MKLSTPLLLASLAANVALVAVVLTRANSKSSVSTPSASISRPATASAETKGSEALRAALAAGDLAALQAAGISAETARELVLGRALARVAEGLRAAKSKGDDRWWRNRGTAAASREQELQARHELSAAMIAVFGDDFGFGGGDGRQFGFLAAEKRAALSRITQDYDEMIAKYSGNEPQLASDREKLKLLREERERDIAALLSPAELAEYQMRTSASAASLRNRYGDAITSEDEFRKLYALQKTYDDKFPPLNGRVTPETMRERSDAARQLQADMRTAIGNDAYAALLRAADPDLRSVDSLVSRLNLPANTTDRIVTERDSFAAASQRISADPALNPQQKRAQIQDLAGRAKANLAATLGTEGADAYTQRSPWVNMLQSGMAFSTTPPPESMMAAMPGNGPGIYPVMPAGGPGGMVGARQVVNFSSGGDVAPGRALPAGDSVFYSIGTTPDQPGRVMTFDAVSVGPGANTGQPGPVTTPTPGNANGPVLIAPGQSVPKQ